MLSLTYNQKIQTDNSIDHSREILGFKDFSNTISKTKNQYYNNINNNDIRMLCNNFVDNANEETSKFEKSSHLVKFENYINTINIYFDSGNYSKKLTVKEEENIKLTETLRSIVESTFEMISLVIEKIKNPFMHSLSEKINKIIKEKTEIRNMNHDSFIKINELLSELKLEMKNVREQSEDNPKFELQSFGRISFHTHRIYFHNLNYESFPSKNKKGQAFYNFPSSLEKKLTVCQQNCQLMEELCKNQKNIIIQLEVRLIKQRIKSKKSKIQNLNIEKLNAQKSSEELKEALRKFLKEIETLKNVS